MAITVNTNFTSLKSQKNLNSSNTNLATSMQRLSSGMRINSAKDDAAGLAISDRLDSQIRGLDVGVRNANDAMSIAQIAEGAMQEQTSMLQRMRDLAVQANNAANSSADKGSLDQELKDLIAQIGDIATHTSFGDTALMTGAERTFQVGHKSAESIKFSVAKTDTTSLGIASLTLTAGGSTALTAIDAAITQIDGYRGKLGAVQNRLSHSISNNLNIQANVADAKSRIVDVDFAKETSTMTKNQVLQQTGSAMLAQANQIPQIALSLL